LFGPQFTDSVGEVSQAFNPAQQKGLGFFTFSQYFRKAHAEDTLQGEEHYF
jgi:hypothetical protein